MPWQPVQAGHQFYAFFIFWFLSLDSRCMNAAPPVEKTMSLYIYLLTHSAQDKRPLTLKTDHTDAWAQRQKILLARYLAFTKYKKTGLLQRWRKWSQQNKVAK
jgi:hypothetical protein